MIGLGDIKEENEVEEGEVHLQEELLPPCKEVKEGQSSSLIWMLCQNDRHGREEERPHSELYEEQQQQQLSQRHEVKEEQQQHLTLQQQLIQKQALRKQSRLQQQKQEQQEYQHHQEKPAQRHQVKEEQQEQQEQLMQIQALNEHQSQQQHGQTQEQQGYQHQQQEYQHQQQIQELEEHQNQQQHRQMQEQQECQHQQEQLLQRQQIKKEQQEQQQQLIQIQELSEQQNHLQHRETQEQQEYQHQQEQQEYQHQQELQEYQHQQQQQQHWEEQQQSSSSSEAWQEERDPLEIEQPPGGWAAHRTPPSLLTLHPGVIFEGSDTMTTAEEEEEEDDDDDEEEEMDAADPSEKMQKEYNILLPIYKDILWSDAFAAVVARGPADAPPVKLEGIRKEHRQLREAVEKAWKLQLIKKTQTTLTDLEQQLTPLLATDKEQQEAAAAAAGAGVARKRKVLEEKVRRTMTELVRIKETKPAKISLPPRDTPLNWEWISAQGFDGTRSALECQLMWNQLLHPAINRKAFSREEDLTIHRLVWTKGKDWDAIAKVLWTQRSGFQVMHHWIDSSKAVLHPVKWSKKDMTRLRYAVNLLRQGEHIPWSQVHQHMPDYTERQIRSRWSRMNPGSRANITNEEKAVLVKATYVFGLDIPNVASFLTRYNITQLRRKLRHHLLDPLLHKPWTRQEDNFLLTLLEPPQRSCPKSSWVLPGRSPGQSRCRYLTLKLWLALQKEDEEIPPPPLFPFANTTDPCKIANLRQLLFKNNLEDVTRLKEAVKDCRKDIQMQPFLDDLVAFRASQELTTSNSEKERVNKPTLPREYRTFAMNATDAGIVNMYFTLINRFLEPGRSWQLPHVRCDKATLKSLQVLSEVMMLQARSTQEEEAGKREAEAEERMKANDSYSFTESDATHEKNEACMSDDDSGLWEKLVEKWEEEEEKRLMKQDEGMTGSSSSGGGVSAGSDGVCSVLDMPYIPPNTTTLATWNSVHIHLSVLTEMARGNFLFQRYSPDQLDTMTEAQLTALLHDEVMPLEAKTCEWQGPKGLKKKTLHKDNSAPDFNTYSRLPRKRTANVEVTSSQQDSQTLPEVSRTTATLPQQDSAPAAATTMSSTSMDGSKEEESTHQTLTRDKADELLFHRMLSLFYWPMVMTAEKPADEEVCETERRVTSSGASKQQKQEPKFSRKQPSRPRKRKQRRGRGFVTSYVKDIGLEKMVQSVDDLKKNMRVEKDRMEDLKERVYRQRGIKRKRAEEAESDTTQPQGPKQPEMQSAPVQDDDEEVEMLDEEDPVISVKKHNLFMFKTKKKLTTLTRSIKMKEVWEKRRQGLCAPRKKRKYRKQREYKPVGTSSRRRSQSPEYMPRGTSTRRRSQSSEYKPGETSNSRRRSQSPEYKPRGTSTRRKRSQSPEYKQEGTRTWRRRSQSPEYKPRGTSTRRR